MTVSELPFGGALLQRLQASVLRLLVMATSLIVTIPVPVIADDDPPQSRAELAAQEWTQAGWPLMKTYCLDCHDGEYAEAEVDLSEFNTLAGVQEQPELAAHAVSIIRFAAMPPDDAELPDVKQRRQLADLLDALVFHAACDLRPRPGHTTARRLNRAEYNHAIRDLFGVDFRPADEFPSDEVGGGFDNNADVLSLSTMLMDKYLTAAEEITSKIIVDPDTLPQVNQTFAGDTLFIIGETQTGSFGQRYVTADGMAWLEVDIPVGGTYSIQVRASPRHPKPASVLSTMHTEDGVLRKIFEHKYRDSRGADDSKTTHMKLDAGTHRLFFRTSMLPASKRKELSDDADWQIGESVYQAIAEMDKKTLEKTRLAKGTSLPPDRNIDFDKFPFRFGRVIIKGPQAATRADLPPGQRKLLGKIPARRGDRYKDAGKTAKKSLRPILRRAFRTEITDQDLVPYVNLVQQMTARGDSYYDAMQVAISAVLVSPRFLFRIEVPDSEQERELARDGEPIPLSSTQLASRLSFFLWSSIPDEELLDAARRDELRDPKKRMEQVQRMLSDPKSRSLGAQFVRQWFGLGDLQSRPLADFTAVAAGDAQAANGITADMLCSETEQLFLHLLHENRPITELLTSEKTYIGPELAAWYGLDYPADPVGGEIAPVSVAEHGRQGILGHAGVLLATSYPTRNSPVLRGKWILENLLGTPPPDAPPGVPALEETQTADADATLREQLEQHRADPGCASCHRVMDALGFGLEDFDHFGRLRAQDDPARGDASGELPGGRSFEGARQLAGLLAKSEARGLAETAVRRMLTFAIGRELQPSDRCFVEAILDETRREGYRVGDLLQQVINSPPFLSHEVELPTT